MSAMRSATAIPRGFRLVQSHVVLRHGDRTPTFNCWEPMGASGEESWAWARKLPRVAEVEEQESAFVDDRPEDTKPRDSNMGVFGSLTRRGLAQTRAVGRALREDYGERLGGEAGKILTYTSNFNRTQRSVQSVLRGILDINDNGGNGYGCDGLEKIPVYVTANPSTDHINVYPHMPQLGQRMKEIVADETHPSGLNAAEKKMAPLRSILSQAIPAFSMFITPFSWITASDHFYCRQMRAEYVRHKVEGAAEDRKDESTEPSELNRATWDYDTLALFHEIDGDGNGEIDLSELREVLDKVCDPPVGDSDMRKMHAAMAAGREGGNIGVAEFSAYVRQGLPPLPEEDQERMAKSAAQCAAEVKALCVDNIDPVIHGGGRDADAETGNSSDIITGVVMAHLCRRFGAWYRDDAILGMAAGRLTRKVVEGFEQGAAAIAEEGGEALSEHRPVLVLHSGHDVTVAPMLSVVKDGGWDPESGDLWPGYAAALRIELLREEKLDGKLFVRALYFPGFHLGNTGNDGDLKVEFEPLRVRGTGAELVPFDSFRKAVEAVAFFEENKCT